ncbi:MAG: lysophospholipase [Clostridia bacterium]|nr:lysophospholipase [Clostridia bacterium]MBQ6614599.1 lysophospholipase [Clostridia bacterium]
MKLHVHFLGSSNGKRDLSCYVYTPDTEVRGILQISHGMCDYIENYARLAEYFCERGYVVCGNDHLGHGNTAEDKRDFGYFGSGGYMSLVKDLRKMNKFIRASYPGVPVVMLGHSMGSFVARVYATHYPDTVDGFIFEGTCGFNNPSFAGKVAATAIAKSRGAHFRSKFLYDSVFRSYNTKFADEGAFAWLSRDKAVCERYQKDGHRNFIFTADGFTELFAMVSVISKPQWAENYPKAKPTLIISGEMDPVGNYGKGPAEVCDRLTGADCENITLKLYEGARHELHAETNKEEFFGDLISWIEKNKLCKG